MLLNLYYAKGLLNEVWNVSVLSAELGLNFCLSS